MPPTAPSLHDRGAERHAAALDLLAAGDRSGARTALEEALDLLAFAGASAVADHVNAACTLAHLQLDDDPGAAAETLTEVAALATELPVDHPAGAIRVAHLEAQAAVARRMGDFAVARDALAEALALIDDAPSLATARPGVQVGLGVVLRYLGYHTDAERLYLAALDGAAQADGDRGEIEIAALHNLAGLYQAAGAPQDAEHHARAALARRRRRSPDDAVAIALEQACLGSILADLGRLSDAETLMRVARDVLASHLGAEHLEVAIATTTLGAICERRGDHDRALTCFRDGVALRERLQGPDHPELAVALINLARAEAQRAPERARAIARRVLNANLRHAAPEHPVRQEAVALLAQST